MAKKILIAGASGLIGTRLTELLLARGYEVAHLGRSLREGKVKSFVWNVDKDEADLRAFDDVFAIVNLAGAGVADQRWSTSRKKVILDSRTKSTKLIGRCLASHHEPVPVYVSASAIGFYGDRPAAVPCTETDAPGTDFLASVVKEWESAADLLKPFAKRVVKLRIGVVLSGRGGALKSLATPVRWGFGATLGSGYQAMSWIHLDDLCEMFIFVIEHENCQGVYNAVGPQPCSNREMTAAIAGVLRRPFWMPAVPSFAMRIIMGEMADIVLMGCAASSKKIQEAGFQFAYAELVQSLRILLPEKAQV